MKTQSSDSRVSLKTTFQRANTITGGSVNLSTEDARAIYKLTTPTSDEQQFQENLMIARSMLRDIAKAILFTGGKSTDVFDLAESFRTNELPDSPNPIESE